MGSIAGEDTDWNIVATSWTVSAGRLADSVAVESPLSPIDDDTAGSAPKTPLLLRPPSPDRSPCEITISLGDMRCAKSMSVRSTARVYRDQVSDGDVPLAANPASRGDSVDEFAEERSKSEINSNAGEVDWVEVKAPSTSFETNRDVAASLKSSVKMVIHGCYACTAGKTYVGPEGAWSAYEIVYGSRFGNRMQL
ncbi:uncharacterized protein LOC120288874 [Eucalyptus grandis]|uniref:uncharacterized protein LOC108955840 n=1 Tax=Eucalyptus grandis TaxID=71139 RepID=UPI00192ECCCE|nr:uncharacterized protein LOC108955840 [Eucalyptus grandis]XP_039159003.1 uncharacterized protein LOC120288874 [Eucalyptus grandis]